MSLILIHGFGETPAVFDQLAPLLPGAKKRIDLWEALGNKKRPELTVEGFCQKLIDRYQIKKDDVVIGHSLGGKLAHHIKAVQGNRTVQLASWTNQEKPNFSIRNPKVLLGLARTGLLFNGLTKQYLLKQYRRPETKVFYAETIQRLIERSHRASVNQLRLLLEPTAESAAKVVPDLRIHARRDNIVRYPDEPFTEVPGDHFSLITHPEEVRQVVMEFLEELVKPY